MEKTKTSLRGHVRAVCVDLKGRKRQRKMR